MVISLYVMYCFNTKLARAASNNNLFEYDNAKNTLDFTAKLIDAGDDYEEPYVDLSLNSKHDVLVSSGDIRYFTYTPKSDSYFVVETYGSLDTKLHVSNTYTGAICDDDSGVGLNAKVEFRGVQANPIYIATKLYNSNISGNYQIQLRKQRVSMFAYDDNKGNSTIPDLNIPFTKLSPMFETIKYENTSASEALLNDERDLAKINSEIMFFSGHGYKNNSTEMGFGVKFKTGGITTSKTINMDRTKVAVWAACYSANSTNSKKISIAEYSINNGAKSSIGFTESISFSSSKTFTNRFFTKLSEGSTVKEAASYGSNGLIWPWDSAKKYVIFGDDSIRITDSTTSSGTFRSRSINTNIVLESNENYYIVDIDQNSKRYYETINGILTNSFVDVIYDDNNNIIDIDDYRKDLSHINSINQSINNQSLLNTISIDNTSYQLDKEISRNIVYVSINNDMTPIIILTGNYVFNEIVIEESRCINLTNGEELEYSEINSL